MGYGGGHTAVTDYLREVRPTRAKPFERRFEKWLGSSEQRPGLL
jgi:hypothetical protein